MEPTKRARGRPKSLFKESSAGTLQSLDRALSLLKALASGGDVALSKLSRQVDIPTATTHRILNTLQTHGFVQFDSGRQEWSVGVEAYRTGAAFLRRNSVVEIGQPYLRALMEQTGETANLAVPDKGEVVFVGQVETPNPIRAFFPAGSRSSMHASGIGKAILAAMSDEKRQKLFQKAEFPTFTAHTLIDPMALERDLQQIRERGWSHDAQERYLGMSCIGACIFDEQANPCAGISVSGPTARFQDTELERMGALVVDAAREITRSSGGRLPHSGKTDLAPKW